MNFHLDEGETRKWRHFTAPPTLSYLNSVLGLQAFFWILDPCRWGRQVVSERAVRNHRYSLRNDTEERSSQLLRGGGLKSLKSRGGKQIPPKRR